MAGRNNYIRGNGGRFAGSTGGNFALTGGSRAGGKAGIKARARFRVAKAILANEGRGRGLANKPERLAQLARMVKRRREVVARIESGKAATRRTLADKLKAARQRVDQQKSQILKGKLQRLRLSNALMSGKPVSARDSFAATRAVNVATRRADRAQRFLERLRNRRARLG